MSKPEVQLDFADGLTRFQPGKKLECNFRIRGDATELTAVETSVLWRSHGKGSEDIGVHFFKRLNKRELEANGIDSIHRIAETLPKSPLSFPGVLVNIDWLVRIKLFLKKGKQETFDFPFQLGDIQPPDGWEKSEAESQTDNEHGKAEDGSTEETEQVNRD